MYRALVIVLIFSLLASFGYAQENESTETESEIFDQLFSNHDQGAEVRIIQEEKLDEILLMFMEQNRQLKGHSLLLDQDLFGLSP